MTEMELNLQRTLQRTICTSNSRLTLELHEIEKKYALTQFALTERKGWIVFVKEFLLESWKVFRNRVFSAQ